MKDLLMNKVPILGVIGCGQMAYAVIKGLKGYPEELVSALYVCDVNSERTALFVQEFAAVAEVASEVVEAADVVLLAVKPQQMMEVLRSTARHWNEQKLIISVAAGIPTTAIEAVLPGPVPVIRTMPNMAAFIGKSATALCAGHYATAEHLSLAEAYMQCIGQTFLYPEKNVDAFGAVAGSGPAYVCLVLEAWVDAAVMQGIPLHDAEAMVMQTMQGTLELLAEEKISINELKRRICSPGGTTIRALQKLEDQGVRSGFFAAVQAAYDRSVELSKS